MINLAIAPAAQAGNAQVAAVGAQTGAADSDPGFTDLLAAAVAQAVGARTDVALPALAGHVGALFVPGKGDSEAKTDADAAAGEGQVLVSQILASVIPSPVGPVTIDPSAIDASGQAVDPDGQPVPNVAQQGASPANAALVGELPLGSDAAAPEGVEIGSAGAFAVSEMEPVTDAESAFEAGPAPAQDALGDKAMDRLEDLLRTRRAPNGSRPESASADPESIRDQEDAGSELARMLGQSNGSARPVEFRVAAAAESVADKPADAAEPASRSQQTVSASAGMDAAIRTQSGAEATQAASEPRSSMPELHQRVIDQVVKEVKLHTLSDGHGLTVKLQPPELGTLHIRLVSDSRGLTSRIEAGSPQVKSLLQAHLPMLSDALSNAGVRVDSVTITSTMDLTASGHDAAREHAQNFHSGQHGRRETASVNFSGEQGSLYRQESATYSWLA